jgi:hypothetical protein
MTSPLVPANFKKLAFSGKSKYCPRETSSFNSSFFSCFFTFTDASGLYEFYSPEDLCYS